MQSIFGNHPYTPGTLTIDEAFAARRAGPIYNDLDRTNILLLYLDETGVHFELRFAWTEDGKGWWKEDQPTTEAMNMWLADTFTSANSTEHIPCSDYQPRNWRVTF